MRQSRWLRSSVVFTDAFGSPAPWWWAAAWQRRPTTSTPSPPTPHQAPLPPCQLLNRGHMLQLSLSTDVLEAEAGRRGLSYATQPSEVEVPAVGRRPLGLQVLPRFASPTETLSSRACLAHARVRCEVSFTRGDVRVVHDIAPFLSCRGRAIGVDDSAALETMAQATARYHYTLPFWLSLNDVEVQLRYENCAFRTHSPFDLIRLSNRVFGDATRTVSLVTDRGTRETVVNIAEWLGDTVSSAITRARLFSSFRRFVPLDIATHQPFAALIEDAIRAECTHSGCWCSIWGTEADFARADAPSLVGPIGIRVFNDVGDELFLTSAMCSDDFIRAYSTVYPDRCIYCVF